MCSIVENMIWSYNICVYIWNLDKEYVYKCMYLGMVIGKWDL